MSHSNTQCTVCLFVACFVFCEISWNFLKFLFSQNNTNMQQIKQTVHCVFSVKCVSWIYKWPYMMRINNKKTNHIMDCVSKPEKRLLYPKYPTVNVPPATLNNPESLWNCLRLIDIFYVCVGLISSMRWSWDIVEFLQTDSYN